jgi:hypothetical protein
MKHRLLGTVERLPSKRYRAYPKPEGRPLYAQTTLADDKMSKQAKQIARR